MLNKDTNRRMVVVMFLLVFGERLFLCRLFGKYGMRVQLLQTLISRITSHERIFVHMSTALFEQSEVVRSAGSECSRNNLVLVVND